MELILPLNLLGLASKLHLHFANRSLLVLDVDGSSARGRLSSLESLPKTHDLAHHLRVFLLVHGHLSEETGVLSGDDLSLDWLVVLNLLSNFLEADDLGLHVAALLSGRSELAVVPQF